MRKIEWVLILLLLAALLVGCGQTSTNRVVPTATTPPITPTTTVQPTVTTDVVSIGQPCVTDISGATKYVQIGDLQVSQVHFLGAYPARQLPSNLDVTRPFEMPANMYDAPNPPVNPHTNDGTGYIISICNTSSSVSHVIVSITARIAAFTPYSGTLNSWQSCDSVFTRPGGVGGGGCGGGYAYDEKLQANFAANATTGTLVTAVPVGMGAIPGNIGLKPGKMVNLSLGITPPTVPGTYTFAFGLEYDTVLSAPISTMQPTLFDSAAVGWNGQNCTKPALLSQIPATVTNPPTNYVCAP